jgi:hypothetical protein
MDAITQLDHSVRRLIFRASAGLGLCALAGCAVSNEGAVDYRKAEILSPPVSAPLIRLAAVAPDAGPADAMVQAQAPKTLAGPVAPARLYRQALRGDDPDALIGANDSISIHLRTAFLKDFEAIIGHPLRGFRPNGEIAIVVKAFEFGKGEDFKFGPDAVREGRLVFYSADVDKGQILNFNNLPVYGPITYEGNPIGIDISVIEIDAEDAQVAALLGTLATIGAQAYPPAAPVLPVLNALGKALLNGDMNDTELRFTLMLDPGAGYAGVSHPTVEAGDYVFIKEENRLATTPWHELEVDANTGRVYRNGSAYVDNTYLTFQINKNLSSTNIDLAENTFGKFLDELDRQDVERAEDLQPFLAELGKLGFARVQARRFGEARDLLTEWQNARRKNEEGEAKRAGFKLVTLIQNALTAPDPAAAELSAEQIGYLLDKLAMMANASTQTEIELFTPDHFKSAEFETVFATVKAGAVS